MKITNTLKYFLLGLLFASAILPARAEGINFHHGSWAEVLNEAKKSNKPIFVDFYTTWCGPCKWMSSNVFVMPEVAAFFNKNFISFKVNAEQEELDLVRSADIRAFPSLVFYDSGGNLLLRHEGALNGESFIEMARQYVPGEASWASAEPMQLSPEQQEKVGAIWELSKSDPILAKTMARDYIRSLPPEAFSQANNWEIISSYGVDYTSDAFRYMASRARQASELPGGNHYLESCMSQLMNAAIANKNRELMAKYKDLNLEILHGLHLDENPQAYYNAEADRYYYSKIEDWAGYMKATTSLLQSYGWSTSATLSSAVLDAIEQVPDKTALPIADSWALRALELEDDLQARTALFLLYYETGRYQEGIPHAEKAYQLASANPGLRQEIQSYITLMGG